MGANQKLKLTKSTPALEEATLTRQIAMVVLELKASKERTADLRKELEQLAKIFQEHGGSR